MNGRSVFFRADSSDRIGTGHIRRCLVLAEYLTILGCRVSFICRNFKGNIQSEIKKKYEVHSLECKSDPTESREGYSSWLGDDYRNDVAAVLGIVSHYRNPIVIVDHYGIDDRWERRIAEDAKSKIIVIDGQLNRSHFCDILVDPNYSQNGVHVWKDLLLKHCLVFKGPEFSFLRNEFLEARKKLIRVGRKRKTVLISFGGVTNVEGIKVVVEALRGYGLEFIIPSDDTKREVLEEKYSGCENITIVDSSSNIAYLMSQADYAFGAGGGMVWERCYMLLPTFAVSLAVNQNVVIRELEDLGVLVFLGKMDKISHDEIADTFESLHTSDENYFHMVRRMADIMSNAGAKSMKKISREIVK